MYYANVSYAKCPEWIKIVNHIDNTELLRGRHSPQMTFYLHDESVLRDDVKQTSIHFPYCIDYILPKQMYFTRLIQYFVCLIKAPSTDFCICC